LGESGEPAVSRRFYLSNEINKKETKKQTVGGGGGSNP
jgi:hypothetical protein